jgi:hypothetical protein
MSPQRENDGNENEQGVQTRTTNPGQLQTPQATRHPNCQRQSTENQDDGEPIATTGIRHRLQQAQRMWQHIFSGDRPSESTASSMRRPIILSRRNARTNNHWGDPLLQKPEGCTRIYAANVNGLQIDQRGGQYDDICKTTKEVDADIFCESGYDSALSQTDLVRNIKPALGTDKNCIRIVTTIVPVFLQTGWHNHGHEQRPHRTSH